MSLNEALASLPELGDRAFYKNAAGAGPHLAFVCGVGNGPDGAHTLLVVKPSGAQYVTHAVVGTRPSEFVLASDLPGTPVVYV